MFLAPSLMLTIAMNVIVQSSKTFTRTATVTSLNTIVEVCNLKRSTQIIMCPRIKQQNSRYTGLGRIVSRPGKLGLESKILMAMNNQLK